ncbi:DUF2474 domain-containing protein [Massilia sp. PAMC28688]|nr:DUF2474 domain-containing protein [Massilia sp. PAMC28688]QYF93767.1 DUF2474 domain-containing protein [Massilia sp. PAMC28688]
MDDKNNTPGPWWKRLGWLILIWVLSVAALGIAAALMKVVMNAVGLSS